MSPSHASRDRRREALAMLAFVALAFAVLRRWPWHLGEGIAAGTEPCDTVPLAMSWTLGWSFDRFDAGLVGYWDAPIFHPTPGTFAFSEPMPLVAAMAWPAHLAGASLATATTLALLTQLVLDGWLVRRWLRRLGVGRALGTLGGAITLLLPFLHQELGVLPLVPVWGIAWMLTALHELLGSGRRPGARAGLQLGLATTAAWLCSAQLTLFAIVLLGPCALVLVRRRHLVRALPGALGVAGLVASVGVLPVALAQRHALVTEGLARTPDARRQGAARPFQLWRVPWRGPLPLPSVLVAKRPSDRAFDPGPLRTAVALGGLVGGTRRRRWRRRTLMLLVLTLGAVVLALGHHARIGAFVPAEALAHVVPGLDRIRSVFRAIVLAQLGVVALSMIGLHLLRVRLRARRRGWRGRAALAVVATLVFVELWPPAPRWTTLPDVETDWARWLRESAEPGTAIAWLPFAPSGDVCDYEPTAAMMVVGLGMDHPLVNGYSSYFTGRHDRTARDTRSLPEPRALQRLRIVDTRFIVSPDDGPLSGLDADTLAALGVEPRMHDTAAGIRIYALRPEVVAPAPTP